METIPADNESADPRRLSLAAWAESVGIARTLRRLAPAAEWALLALLAAYFAIKGLVVGWQSLNTDFPNYYLVAKLFRQGYPLDRVYDWTWIQRQKDHAGIDRPLVGYVPLTLFSALLVSPLVALGPLDAKRVWLVLNVAMLGGTIWLLRRLTEMPLRRIGLLVFLTVIPLRTNFLYGQQHLLILFLLSLAAWLDAQGRLLASGTAVAAAAALKIYPAFFVLYFIRKRRWRALGGFAAAGAGLLALGLALFGYEAMRVYLVQILPRTLRAECNDPFTVTFGSATTLLRRLLVGEPILNPDPLVHWPGLYVWLQPLIEAAVLVPGLWMLTPGRAAPRRESLEWAGFTALLLALSVGSATYHFCVLILPTVIAVGVLLEARRTRDAFLLVVLHLVVCSPTAQFFPLHPGGWKTFLGFPRLAALACYWIFLMLRLLWRRPVASASPPIWSGPARPDGSRAAPSELWAFGALFGVLVAIGVAGNRRHFAHQFDDYPARLETGPASFVTAAPSVGTLGGPWVYFSRMEAQGFVVARTGPRLTVEAPPNADVFAPAIDQRRGVGWLEIASPSRTQSAIARFALGASIVPAQMLPIDVDDGEQPVLSSDGDHLGFLRPERGRGQLYLVERVRDDSAAAPVVAGAWGAPRAVTAAPADVLEVGFLPDDGLILSAFRDGRARLFESDAGAGRFVELALSPHPVRFPAVSPDGAWLAYSEEEAGAWHLWVAKRAARVDVASWSRHRVAEGDCNTMSPVWLADSRTVIYASDCGRGLGHTVLCQRRIVP